MERRGKRYVDYLEPEEVELRCSEYTELKTVQAKLILALMHTSEYENYTVKQFRDRFGIKAISMDDNLRLFDG